MNDYNMMKFLIMLDRRLVKYRCAIINDDDFEELTIDELI